MAYNFLNMEKLKIITEIYIIKINIILSYISHLKYLCLKCWSNIQQNSIIAEKTALNSPMKIIYIHILTFEFQVFVQHNFNELLKKVHLFI